MQLEPSFIVDDQDNRVAAVLDIKTFERVEETLEAYALHHSMPADDEGDETLPLDQAKAYYETLLQGKHE